MNRQRHTKRLLTCLAAINMMVLSTAWAEEEPRDLTTLDLDFSSDNWVEDNELGDALLSREYFKGQAIDAGADNPPYWESSDLDTTIPETFTPWWEQRVQSPLSRKSEPVYESPESLFLRAIAHSSQIRVFADVPVIRETAELEARGAFDTHLYLDGKLTDLDDPVGNLLETGGPDRFLEDEWSTKLGLRKKFITGTELDLSQRIGELDNNSEFLDPKEQARTRIALTLTQPLLKGFGVRYNRSMIDIARIDGSVALDEFQRQVESHLLDIERAYWTLYQERVSLLQRRRLVENGQAVVKEMEGRVGHDVGPAQMSRARAKLASWKSDLTRAETAVRNAESKILGLVNDPNLRLTDRYEMITMNSPSLHGKGMSTEMAMNLAIENRPEIEQAFKQIKAAASRAHMSKMELMPELNLVVQYYRAGLAGNYDINEAVDTQSDGDGSWVAGLAFDFPLRNREARARHTRRQAEVRQLNGQLRTTLETIKLELEVSTREIKTARREMDAKYAAMEAAKTEVNVLKERSGVEVESGGVHYLERLLGATQRLAESEHEFLQSQVIYNIALANLDRATGTMLQAQNIGTHRYEDERSGLPVYRLKRKPEG